MNAKTLATPTLPASTHPAPRSQLRLALLGQSANRAYGQ